MTDDHCEIQAGEDRQSSLSQRFRPFAFVQERAVSFQKEISPQTFTRDKCSMLLCVILGRLRHGVPQFGWKVPHPCWQSLQFRCPPIESTCRATTRQCFFQCWSSENRHLVSGLLMVPGVDFFVYSYKGALMPQEHEYEEVCKRCSATLFTPTPQDSGSDTDPSTDIDQDPSVSLLASSSGWSTPLSIPLALFLLLRHGFSDTIKVVSAYRVREFAALWLRSSE